MFLDRINKICKIGKWRGATAESGGVGELRVEELRVKSLEWGSGGVEK